jgi:hypothetical protein
MYMPGLEPFVSLFGYGPAPGLELIPYFLGLLAWAGLAVVAVLLAPFSALVRRIRRPKTPMQSEQRSTATAACDPGLPGEGSHNTG